MTYYLQGPFTCDKCGKVFKERRVLKEHENLHSEPKVISTSMGFQSRCKVHFPEYYFPNPQLSNCKTSELDIPKQGRIQDLSEGGARFISEQKHPD